MVHRTEECDVKVVAVLASQGKIVYLSHNPSHIFSRVIHEQKDKEGQQEASKVGSACESKTQGNDGQSQAQTGSVVVIPA